MSNVIVLLQLHWISIWISLKTNIYKPVQMFSNIFNNLKFSKGKNFEIDMITQNDLSTRACSWKWPILIEMKLQNLGNYLYSIFLYYISIILSVKTKTHKRKMCTFERFN